jgi:hypothetical protein
MMIIRLCSDDSDHQPQQASNWDIARVGQEQGSLVRQSTSLALTCLQGAGCPEMNLCPFCTRARDDTRLESLTCRSVPGRVPLDACGVMARYLPVLWDSRYLGSTYY